MSGTPPRFRMGESRHMGVVCLSLSAKRSQRENSKSAGMGCTAAIQRTPTRLVIWLLQNFPLLRFQRAVALAVRRSASQSLWVGGHIAWRMDKLGTPENSCGIGALLSRKLKWTTTPRQGHPCDKARQTYKHHHSSGAPLAVMLEYHPKDSALQRNEKMSLMKILHSTVGES